MWFYWVATSMKQPKPIKNSRRTEKKRRENETTTVKCDEVVRHCRYYLAFSYQMLV
jgi:hypothetical protein